MSGLRALRIIVGLLAVPGLLHGPAVLAAGSSAEVPRLAGMLSIIGNLLEGPHAGLVWAGGGLLLLLLGFALLIRRMILRERMVASVVSRPTRAASLTALTRPAPFAGNTIPPMTAGVPAAGTPSAPPATAATFRADAGPDGLVSRSGPATVPGKLQEKRDGAHATAAHAELQDKLERADHDDAGGFDSDADHESWLTDSFGSDPFASDPFNADAFHAEDDSEVVIQAELLMERGLTDDAIAVLLKHIREAEKPMPMAWLTLFDVFTRTGRRAHYEALSNGFSTLFNAIAPSWRDLQSDSHKRLEDYPAVFSKVQRLWGLPTCRAFLESLLHDDRGGSRQGFLLTAYRDILFLIEIIDTLESMALEDEVQLAIVQRKSSSA